MYFGTRDLLKEPKPGVGNGISKIQNERQCDDFAKIRHPSLTLP
jgi:hypothetical protein